VLGRRRFQFGARHPRRLSILTPILHPGDQDLKTLCPISHADPEWVSPAVWEARVGVIGSAVAPGGRISIPTRLSPSRKRLPGRLWLRGELTTRRLSGVTTPPPGGGGFSGDAWPRAPTLPLAGPVRASQPDGWGSGTTSRWDRMSGELSRFRWTGNPWLRPDDRLRPTRAKAVFPVIRSVYRSTALVSR
jgi:hypothetical protein